MLAIIPARLMRKLELHYGDFKVFWTGIQIHTVLVFEDNLIVKKVKYDYTFYNSYWERGVYLGSLFQNAKPYGITYP